MTVATDSAIEAASWVPSLKRRGNRAAVGRSGVADVASWDGAVFIEVEPIEAITGSSLAGLRMALPLSYAFVRAKRRQRPAEARRTVCSVPIVHSQSPA